MRRGGPAGRLSGARRRLAVAVVAVLLPAAACGPRGPTPDTATGTRAASTPARFGFGAPADEARIALWDIDVRPDGAGLPAGSGKHVDGVEVYRMKCAACHGRTGTEGPFDVLVGGPAWADGDPPRPRTIGNYWPYATTLFDYVRRAMPQNAPGTLTAGETYAVVAWLLAENGLVAPGAVMDATTLPAVVMPASDRFVPDDRRGGGEVR
jgi:cytochrome c